MTTLNIEAAPFGSVRACEDGFAWIADKADGWQFGEQGMLGAIFAKLSIPCSCVEVGGGDGSEDLPLTCEPFIGDGVTVVEKETWRCAAIASKYPKVRVVEREAGPNAGIDDLFPANLLVIDVDSIDYYIWERCSAQPAVVMIEQHDLYDGDRNKTAPALIPEEDCGKVLRDNFGQQCTVAALDELAKAKGYVPVVRTRINSIYVRADLAESLRQPPDAVRLNLGAGRHRLAGFISVDIKEGKSCYPLDYADESVDEIYASHVLEHFSHRQTMDVLREWKRVLKPWGKIRIAVPDFEKCIEQMKSGSIPFNLFEGYVFGGHTDEYDKHGAMFSRQKLTSMLHACGFENVKPWESRTGDCSLLPISLNLEAQKRAFKIEENPNIVAVISQPRIAFTHSMLSLHASLRALCPRSVFHGGKEPIADIVYCGGAFWEKFITGGIKRALSMGAKYLLFADYDGVFMPSDAEKLIDVLNKNPDVSAAFALQVSRHNDNPLVYDHRQAHDGELSDVQLGHFGLCAIRAEVFDYLPKPWFWSMPNPDTLEWDEDGHCDADITFWRNLREFGHRVVQVNTIQVGHMDLCVKWLTPRGIAYQPVKHYERTGKLKEAAFDPKAYAPKKPDAAANGKA